MTGVPGVVPGPSAPAPGPGLDRRAVPAALVTDLYELTMAAAYQAGAVTHEATFELFVRTLPDERRFLVAAGLDDALAGLESWRYDEGDVAYLGGLGTFPERVPRPPGRPALHRRRLGRARR